MDDLHLFNSMINKLKSKVVVGNGILEGCVLNRKGVIVVEVRNPEISDLMVHSISTVEGIIEAEAMILKKLGRCDENFNEGVKYRNLLVQVKNAKDSIINGLSS